jgi:transcriptional regulator with XRE-family HTH domain
MGSFPTVGTMEGRSFGQLLRALRTNSLLSQEQLAHRSGVSVRTIRDLECGRVAFPHGQSVRLLADALQLVGGMREGFEALSRRPGRPDAGTSHEGTAMVPAGRREELLARLCERLTAAQERAGSVVVVIHGPAGAGKTRLANELLHALGDAFPDGRLRVDLCGTRRSPGTPVDVLEYLLDRLGARLGAMPAGLAARAAAYRTAIAGRRLLIVLDDAEEAQARHLVSASPGCAVVITSRRPLHELTDAIHVALDAPVLAPGGAHGAVAPTIHSGNQWSARRTVQVRATRHRRGEGRPAVRWPVTAPPDSPAVPAQLPMDTPVFAGRRGELARLDMLLAGGGNRPTAVVTVTLSGTAGAGKTALAVHWAHQVRDRFPDGQLYVNLHGFGPGPRPMSPAQAIRGFLEALGVTADRMPADPDAQTTLYRSLLADHRALVVLDNAVTVDQVRPLLPGAPGCMVIVTSRDQMGGLVTAEGAHPLTIDVLTATDAWELLADRLGTARLDAEPRAVAEIIDRCARLPSALAMLATRAVTHPEFPLGTLVEEMRAAHDLLEIFGYGDPTTDLRASFSWSYNRLSAPAARLFRLLGNHPEPDVSPSAAAALAGIPERQARAVLAELCRGHLIVERSPGRFRAHELLLAYAAELARVERKAVQ